MLGGKGVRFGSSISKQFCQLKSTQEEVIFELATSRILSIPSFKHLLFIIPQKIKTTEMNILEEALIRLKNQHPKVIFELTKGGNNRHQSFLKAFLFLEQKNFKPKVLAVHDANRPFLSDNFIARVNQEVEEMSSKKVCSIPIIPMIDSIIFNNEDSLTYLPREKFYCVQTPQLLWWNSVVKAFKVKKVNQTWSDEGSFMLEMGFSSSYYSGELGNKKITYPKDIL